MIDPQVLALSRDIFLQMLMFSGICFLVSEITGNYSQTDKLWSLTPIVYAWTVAAQAGLPPRALLMAALITLWGARLTYNFARQGGYSIKPWDGHEDYRWRHVRAHPLLAGRFRFMLFNLGFIAFYQHFLLWLISWPVVFAALSPRPLGAADAVLAVVFLALLAVETVADRQQWDFQTEKKRRQAAGGDIPEPWASGFVQSGLWARSRHPNYFAEQSIWVLIFAFSVVAAGFNVSVVGCVLLILLFQGSSRLAENISSAKYPGYAGYQQRVPRFIPRLF